jgi:DNA modification methylase
MEPTIVVENARVFHGDCREVLRSLPDNSVDSVVTDPPYELGFMGKKWDSSGIAYDATVWQECLRVLKPGGHILAFGGSRTWHRLAVAVEDAGFELRDSIAWIYGSGFPKSLDVSKAIDKRGGIIPGQSRFASVLKQAKSQTNLTIADLNEVLGRRTSNLWSHFVGDVQPLLPTVEQYWKLKSVLPIPDEWDLQFLPEAEREVIGQGKSGKTAIWNEAGEMGNFDLTAPATSEAQKWQGWGTALKPAFEPVVVGRKPLVGTVAENVLQWGVGGLNIDGSRIGTQEMQKTSSSGTVISENRAMAGPNYGRIDAGTVQGRWPANVILDEVSAGLLDEQTGDETSRFFYQAKASKRDRNEGLEELQDSKVGSFNGNAIQAPGNKIGAKPEKDNLPGKNFHPTVKPTQLMRYLIKLVTPEGGTVLDPFTGSGSTGKAALLDGFAFIGAELTAEYLPIIEGRLRWAVDNREVPEETLF